MIAYILPFVVFLLFTALASYIPNSQLWLYPTKTIIVGAMLIWFRKSYTEISYTAIKWKPLFYAIVIGLIVFVIWILPQDFYPNIGTPKSISPYELAGQNQLVAIIWICFRLVGVAVVVPVMEELFWRSFLLRYTIHPNFKSVPLGKFTWFSLVITTILFGVEHPQWIAGMIAGILYTILLYRTKSLFACILAHGITNLTLGIYVLATQKWMYW